MSSRTGRCHVSQKPYRGKLSVRNIRTTLTTRCLHVMLQALATSHRLPRQRSTK